MIPRYENPEIAAIWTQANKGLMWQRVELAVVRAKEVLGEAKPQSAERMDILLSEPIDVEEWNRLDGILHHDFNAFLAERLRFLTPVYHPFWHPGTTSYDTEEPAFALMLTASLEVVKAKVARAEEALVLLARRYRYTPMYARTHGQGAKVQTFGKRCLTYLVQLRFVRDELLRSAWVLEYSKLSGAVGNYGGRLSPELERETLKILGLKPFYGATQIMPRVLYVPFATNLSLLVDVLDQIALDLRLSARSGLTLMQEPFAAKQKGSSAMPHKKNTIGSENTAGMARLANVFLQAIKANVVTWEERAIEQSSVERVAWSDLFHVVCQALKTMTKILKGLRVYPDQMMRELYEARGCYASDEAKEVLKQLGVPFGLESEAAYRIVQLAAFNVFEPGDEVQALRDTPSASLPRKVAYCPQPNHISIERVIREGLLRPSDQLDITEDQVVRWNESLRQMFDQPENVTLWQETFRLDRLLRHEQVLFREILGE